VDAVVRNFEIIGEASNRIPDDFKTEHPEIEWRRIIGFRNRIIHEYFGIDYENLWRIKNRTFQSFLNLWNKFRRIWIINFPTFFL
jgi:uncharacterized protein with HEPN domain